LKNYKKYPFLLKSPSLIYKVPLFKIKEIPVKLLIDIGNSDALWLFQDRSELIKTQRILKIFWEGI
jgi:hypothetical protein